MTTLDIVPYDGRWPLAFIEERDRIAVALGPLALRIEHPRMRTRERRLCAAEVLYGTNYGIQTNAYPLGLNAHVRDLPASLPL